MFTFIEARAATKDSIYSQAWEACEGTECLTLEEFRELALSWHAEERAAHGRVVSDYRFMRVNDDCDTVVAKYIVLSSGNPSLYIR